MAFAVSRLFDWPIILGTVFDLFEAGDDLFREFHAT